MIVQGGRRRNNCFIASDNNAAISINNRFITWEVIILRALLFYGFAALLLSAKIILEEIV